MKETTRASIGGFAFNVDTDAHDSLSKYLQELSDHYKNKEDGSEILSDIEARMSELLSMKLTYPDRIVTLADAEEIIATMGRPNQLFDEDYESGGAEETTTDEEPKPNPKASTPPISEEWRKKRLYRDVDHKIIGGVCSGLGHYLRIDPVLVRIGFIFLLILTNSITPELSMFAVVVYFILWIAMPKAKTMSEKIVMTRTNPTVEGIANRENPQNMKTRGSRFVKALVTIFKVFVGGTSLLIGISLLLATIAVVIGLIVDSPLTSKFIFALPYFGFGITEISTPLLVFLFTFSLIFIHFGTRLIFSKLKLVDFIVIGIATIISISSLMYLLTTIKAEVSNYKKHAIETEFVAIQDSLKTINIALDQDYRDHSTISNSMFWYRSNENNQWFSAPSVVIVTDTTQTKTEISIEKKFYAKSRQLARRLAKQGHIEYTVKGDSLLLSPDFRGEKAQWDRNFFKIIVKPAKGVKVNVGSPLRTYYTTDYRLDRDLGQPFHEKDFTFRIELME